MSSFNWKENCFICSKQAVIDPRHPDRNIVQTARTLQIRTNVLERCTQRSDDLASMIEGILQTCIDLVAGKQYNIARYQAFLSKSGDGLVGRPACKESTIAFERVCQWLDVESETEMITLTEIEERMKELSPGENVYSRYWLKKRLREHYGDHIYFTEVPGSKTVVCFQNMVD